MNNNDTSPTLSPTFSPTPRTDAAQWFDPMCDFLFVVPADLACQLELELAAVTKELDDAIIESTNAVNDIIRVIHERDQAREQMHNLAEALEKILDYKGKYEEDEPASIAVTALRSFKIYLQSDAL